MLNHDESYTTEELARILKVSKLTVYDLIKKGELQAYRVGRQMRVDRSELENYKLRQKEGKVMNLPLNNQINKASQQASPSIVICGQDNSLDLLTRELGLASLRSQVGSLDGLMSMYQGKSHIVSTHLFDGETNSYNLPYIRRILVSHSFVVIRFIKRQAGLYVAKGNPKKVTGWKDFSRHDLRLVNREKGAGARVLLEEQLRLHGIQRHSIKGFHDVQTSHLGVASTISSGKADVGVGIKHTAKMANIDFIPMINENYDLVVTKNEETSALIDRLLHILSQPAFQEKLLGLHYEIDGIGQIIYEQ
ncbi:MAG TPA: substrate-binding domain-containing protein [Cerasibacillus sp.]|uniref:substrate-binding domain-containing protein n=1 Tax=Cerasibacillus sp. TaxID=2498711 RepID=UPI002F3E7FCA